MTAKIISYAKNNKLFLLGLLALALYCLPLIILGEKAFIVGHDNLDGELLHRLLVAKSSTLFSISQTDKIYQIMNGIPRASLPSGFNFTVIFYKIFSPFWAYAVNDIIVRLIAYFSMYLLLQRYIIPGEKNKLAQVGAALCFAILPYYSIYGAIIAAQPFLIYSFLNIFYKRQTLLDYIVIILFPFYVSLVWSYSVLTLLTIMLLFLAIKKKQYNPAVFIWLGILFLLSAVSDLPMVIQTFFNHNYISQRQEFNLYILSSKGKDIPSNVIEMFFNGQYHAVSLHKLILIIFLPLAIILGLWKKSKDRSLVILLLFVIFYIALFFGFFGSEYFIYFKEKINFLKTFQLDRFYFLQASLWYLIFAISLKYILAIKKFGKWLAALIIIIQAGFILFYTTGFVFNLENTTRVIAERKPSHKIVVPAFNRHLIATVTASYPFYEEYYSVDEFNQIKDYIGLPQESYRIVSPGIEPEVPQYSGFYTLDSYQPNYPLEYKHQFRQIISKELVKDPGVRDYFDAWGNRCYFYVISKNPELDYQKFKEMGGKYILSTVKYNFNPNLTFEKEFDGYYKIYLYKVN